MKRDQEHEKAPEEIEESRMTLGEHLDELRRRLIYSAIAISVVLVGCWSFHEEIAQIVEAPFNDAVEKLEVDWADILEERLVERQAEDPEYQRKQLFLTNDPEDQRPLSPIRDQLRGDSATTGFFYYLRISFYFTMFIAGPIVIWQIWQFIAAGLYKKERRIVYRYLPAAMLLFVAGVVFGYLYMVPFAYYTLSSMALEHVEFDPEVTRYLTFLTALTLALGAVFLLPIVMVALSRVGLVDPALYNRYRGHFIVGALVMAAVITPPDPITQLLMAVPMAVLFELGHLAARIAWKRNQRSAAAAAGEA